MKIIGKRHVPHIMMLYGKRRNLFESFIMTLKVLALTSAGVLEEVFELVVDPEQDGKIGAFQ